MDRAGTNCPSPQEGVLSLPTAPQPNHRIAGPTKTWSKKEASYTHLEGLSTKLLLCTLIGTYYSAHLCMYALAVRQLFLEYLSCVSPSQPRPVPTSVAKEQQQLRFCQCTTYNNTNTRLNVILSNPQVPGVPTLTID